MRVWTVSRHISVFKSNNCIRNYARFIPNDKIVTLDNSTLTGRLILFLKPETTELTQKTDNFETNELLDLLKRKNLARLNISNKKLLSFISSLEDQNLIKSNKEFYKFLRFVDEECCSRHENLEIKEIMDFLDVYLELIPNRVTQLKFYGKAIDTLFSKRENLRETSQLDLNAVIDIFWYLWMLNHKCYRLVPYLLEKRDLLDQLLQKNSTRQRLNQLLVCIYYEDRFLFNKLSLKPCGKADFIPSQHLKNRPCLQNVLNALNTIGKRRNMKFELNYQIPHMNILGIIGFKKNIYKSVHVEVLDHFTSLNNSNWRPTGLMQTKLRILDGSEEGLIVLKKSEIDDRTVSQLEQFLEDELNLVC